MGAEGEVTWVNIQTCTAPVRGGGGSGREVTWVNLQEGGRLWEGVRVVWRLRLFFDLVLSVFENFPIFFLIFGPLVF